MIFLVEVYLLFPSILLHSELVIGIQDLEQSLILFLNLFGKVLAIVLQFLVVVEEFGQDLNVQMLLTLFVAISIDQLLKELISILEHLMILTITFFLFQLSLELQSTIKALVHIVSFLELLLLFTKQLENLSKVVQVLVQHLFFRSLQCLFQLFSKFNQRLSQHP